MIETFKDLQDLYYKTFPQVVVTKLKSKHFKSSKNIPPDFKETGRMLHLALNDNLHTTVLTTSPVKRVTYEPSDRSFYLETYNSIYNIKVVDDSIQHELIDKLHELSVV
jgi:hypothetical protein